MTLEQIKDAVDNGLLVIWSNPAYQVIKDKTDYLIQHKDGSCIGLTHQDGVTLNGEPHEFYVA